MGLRLAMAALSGLLACASEGDGKPGDIDGGTGLLVLSPSALTFEALAGDTQAIDAGKVQISWSHEAVAGAIVEPTPGEQQPPWLQTDLAVTKNPLSLTLTVNVRPEAMPAAVGRYETKVRITTRDEDGAPLAHTDLPVALDVIGDAVASPNPVTVQWPRSGEVPPTKITIIHDARVRVLSVKSDAAWLNADLAGDEVTLTGTATANGLGVGTHSARVTITSSFAGRTRTLVVPVTGKVLSALSGPAQMDLVVTGQTRSEELVLRGTYGQEYAGITVAVQADVPWISTPASLVTGTTDNLSVSIVRDRLASLPNGVHKGNVTITGAGIPPFTVPVTLTLRLPEAHFVGPVVFTDTSASDHVIARGEGFTKEMKVWVGEREVGVRYVSETEIRFVPGVQPAGEHPVVVENRLGVRREGAAVRVFEPPNLGPGSLPVTLDTANSLLASSRGVVFMVAPRFTGMGTPAVIQRFVWDPTTRAWTRTQYFYSNLFAAVLTPDERTLVVLTATHLLLVDPDTMVEKESIPMPDLKRPPDSLRCLAVTSDGLVVIAKIQLAYSLRRREFLPMPAITADMDRIIGSRDGSRIRFCSGSDLANASFSYYDASTGTSVKTTTVRFCDWGPYSRHAERALSGHFLLSGDLAVTYQFDSVSSDRSDFSPDAQRVYGSCSGLDGGNVCVYDISDPVNVRRLDPIPFEPGNKASAFVAEPHGDYVFVVSGKAFYAINVK